jgi:hypothetical protein
MLLRSACLATLTGLALAGTALGEPQTESGARSAQNEERTASRASEFRLRLPGESWLNRSSTAPFNLRLPRTPPVMVPRRSDPGSATRNPNPNDVPTAADEDPDAIIRLPG